LQIRIFAYSTAQLQFAANVFHMLKKCFFVSILLSISAFYVAAFFSETRYSVPIKSNPQIKSIACMGESLGGNRDNANILIIGSSRVRQSFSNRQISKIASDSFGAPIISQSLGLPGPNLALSLQFFKEYLKNYPNPAVSCVRTYLFLI